MRLIYLSIIVFLTLFLLTSCSNDKQDKLVGCYTIESEGKAELKITKENGRYYILMREGDSWSNPEGLHQGDKEDIESLFNKDASRIKASLVADKGAFGIFLVNAGETYGGEKAKSDYLAFIMFGGGSVYKIDCK